MEFSYWPGMASIRIIGGGLAGSCLAWQLRWRGAAVVLEDDHRDGAASRVAAGLVNPVTGKNYQPSWRIGGFLPEAVAFYRKVEEATASRLWHPLPVVRLVSECEWDKVAGKLERPEVAAWVEQVDEAVAGWRAAVVLKGGGRLDTRRFCEVTGEAFGRMDGPGDSRDVVRCGGAFDLLDGRLGEHRCAKGEILTLAIPGQDESRILVGGGGWLVPIGGGRFKAGATYQWDQLDGRPTPAGRARVEEILQSLGVGDFTLLAHEAGIRPIIRRSQPLIGRIGDDWIFNGLGSKGSLYAPGAARRMAEAIVDGREIEAELDLGRWLER